MHRILKANSSNAQAAIYLQEFDQEEMVKAVLQ